MDYVGVMNKCGQTLRGLIVLARSERVSKRSCAVQVIGEDLLSFFLGKILPMVCCFCTIIYSGCVKMAGHICVGVVAEVYVEYHGERTMSTTTLVVSSDFEDEIQEPGDDDQPDIVITAKSAES
jgi:hypothetical protein